jgi:hypothetical protein
VDETLTITAFPLRYVKEKTKERPLIIPGTDEAKIGRPRKDHS